MTQNVRIWKFIWEQTLFSLKGRQKIRTTTQCELWFCSSPEKICNWKHAKKQVSFLWILQVLQREQLCFSCTPYARHHNSLLIWNHSWILTIHKARILTKSPLKKRFWTSEWMKHIETAGYNGARTVHTN